MLDIIYDRGQNSLIDRGDSIREFLRGHACEIPDCGTHRDIDVRKNVLGSLQNGNSSGDQDKDRQDDKRVGAPER
jgi:hypothetical protein